MNVNTQTRTRKMGESLISAISVGAVLVLVGMVFVLAQPSNLWDNIITFFSSFTLRSAPGTGISLPAPANPAAHAVLYNAAFQFCIGIGILQIILLALRLMMHSSTGKTAETFGNLIYWFGASYLIISYLNNTTTISGWFMFWAGILIVLGVSFIARAFFLLVKKR